MESIEPLIECNFPELLASDLELSSDIFRSKNLTAGAPSPYLAGDGSKRRYSVQDRAYQPAPSALRLELLLRMKSQQELRHSDSQLAGKRRKSSRVPSSGSDTEASESSTAMEPFLSSGQDLKLTTPATSVSSAYSSPSFKSAGQSWVDLDTADKPGLSRSHSVGQLHGPSRPLSRKDEVEDARTLSLGSIARPNGALVDKLAYQQLFSTFDSESTDHSQYDGHSLSQAESNLRSPSLLDQSAPNAAKTDMLVVADDYSSCLGQSCPSGSSSEMDNTDRYSLLSKSDISEIEDMRVQAADPGLHIAPPVNIDNWLESTSHLPCPRYPQQNQEVSGTRLPLPTDILDTLRVSVSCFPETMLLCSSLSIETIRGQSRKLKYSSHSNGSQATLPYSMNTNASSKHPKWRWLASKASFSHSVSSGRSRVGSIDSMEPVTLAPEVARPSTPDWVAIKNVFPMATDYLCDALYAHILAYNYITNICPPTPAGKSANPSVLSLKENRSSSRMELSRGSTQVPRKAAMMLGIDQDPPEVAPEPPIRGLRARGSRLLLRARTPTPSTDFPLLNQANRTADNQDQSLPDLRAGLAQCVARLVATLQSTTEEPCHYGRAKKPQYKDTEPVLLRALCEIVRCAEES